MKNRRILTAILSEVILMAGLLSFLSGCFGRKDPAGPGTDAPQNAPETAGAVETDPANDGGMPGTPPGELVGIRFEMSGGSMNFHSEFGIEVTPDEIVWAEYWPEEDYGIDITRKEHVPVTEAQWGDLVRIVGDLFEELRPVPEKTPGEDEALLDGEDIEILDGGDYWLLYLTWRTADGDKTVQYYNTSDRREQTLVSLLMELAEPIGREIVWYEAPVISGVFYYDKKNEESLQCTRFDEGTYYFIARYYETPAAKKKGEKRDVTKIVSDEIWADFAAFFEPLEEKLKRFPSGRTFDDPLAMTVYQSDGRQYTVRPDAETAEKIRAFFVEKAPVIADMKSMR